MRYEISDLLISIEVSHQFAKTHKHGLELHGKWKLFEPTKFIYSFFSFNMIYSIDWESTLEKNKIRYKTNVSAKKLFHDTIHFITAYDENIFEKELEKLDPTRKMYSVINKMTYDRNSNRESELTYNTIAQDFKKAAQKFSEFHSLNSDDHFKLLQMSYAVRNNIFHGEKKATQMIETGQRERLIHYTNIILATNESFFEVMKNKHFYRRIENSEVYENII